MIMESVQLTNFFLPISSALRSWENSALPKSRAAKTQTIKRQLTASGPSSSESPYHAAYFAQRRHKKLRMWCVYLRRTSVGLHFGVEAMPNLQVHPAQMEA